MVNMACKPKKPKAVKKPKKTIGTPSRVKPPKRKPR